MFMDYSNPFIPVVQISFLGNTAFINSFMYSTCACYSPGVSNSNVWISERDKEISPDLKEPTNQAKEKSLKAHLLSYRCAYSVSWENSYRKRKVSRKPTTNDS
jgi:hypothetical protein